MKLARLRPLALTAALLVTGCGADPADAEGEIRAVLAAAEAAAEARDVGFFRDFAGSGYRDMRGNDRDQLLNMLRGYFIAHQKIEIVSRVDEIRIEAVDAAHAVVHAGFVGQRTGEPLLGGLGGDLYRFEVELIDDGGEWRMIGAKWERGTGE
jgi:hypothetical protein